MTTFYFVRHGEPAYDTVGDWSGFPFGKECAGLTKAGCEQIKHSAKRLLPYKPACILSSPYTRALQSAAILSKELKADIVVEHDLHEWETDRSHQIRDEKALVELCRQFDKNRGIYPDGEEPLWESREMMKNRVESVLMRWLDYDCIVVAGHALMMQSVSGIERPLAYGEIVKVECGISK